MNSCTSYQVRACTCAISRVGSTVPQPNWSTIEFTVTAEAKLTAQETSRWELPCYFKHQSTCKIISKAQHCAQRQRFIFLMLPRYMVQGHLLFQISSQFHSYIFIFLPTFCNELKTTKASKLGGSNSGCKCFTCKNKQTKKMKEISLSSNTLLSITFLLPPEEETRKSLRPASCYC